jgi:hypothetical protein
MKKLLTITALLLFTLPAFAADYKAITKDNEVSAKEDVQVEKAQTVAQKEILTLKYLLEHKALLEARIADLQAGLVVINGQIAAVDNVAKAVKLKAAEVVEPK